MNIVYIYTLTDPISGQVRYVGKTKNLAQRRHNHLNSCRDKNTHKRNWINKLRKKGCLPIMEVIDEVTESEWKYWEKYWIQQLAAWGFDLVNHTEGGDGLSFGNNTSFKKGNKSWNEGKAFTKVCLECGVLFKINPSRSEKRLCCNRKCSTEYRKKHNLYKGVFKKGNISWTSGKKGLLLKPSKEVHQYSTVSGEYIKSWKSALEASIYLNINREGIGRCAREISKTAGGFIWKYKSIKN